MTLASKQDLFTVLRQYNPWWGGGEIRDLPSWQRTAYGELKRWVTDPPARRAVLLSGARQIGKTTLLLQCIDHLLKQKKIKSEQVLYVTFDHPLLKLAGLEAVLDLWREVQPHDEDEEFIFLDEIQHTKDWQTWLKHQVDFAKHRRIVVTGSAIPLTDENVESGVGRWHTIKLATLSFYEYLKLKKIDVPQLPTVRTLTNLFDWQEPDFLRQVENTRQLLPHFHDYLLRGGFPQTALVSEVSTAQKLLREDIIDKVLKRDMTVTFGVRLVLEMEQVFLYLCLHDGGLLDITQMCSQLGMKKATVSRFIEILEAAHLIYRLPQFLGGKKALKPRYKVYLADAAIAGSAMLRGKSLLEDSTKLGAAVETAIFKHLFSRYYTNSPLFSYWHGLKDVEVDIVATMGNVTVPFEVKYTQALDKSSLKGLYQFLDKYPHLTRAYIITRDAKDFGIMKHRRKDGGEVPVLKLPAPLACYWLGQGENELLGQL